MRKLILMRHAKSSWDDPTQDDHARPLNGRGRNSARALGDWLKARGHVPDQVLSSDSARTRETFARLGIICDAAFLPALYHAQPETMHAVLKGASAKSVLMLGHNPGIAWFARDLVTGPPIHPRFDDYPTCATLVAEFAIDDWAALKPGIGQVRDFVIPREITG